MNQFWLSHLPPHPAGVLARLIEAILQVVLLVYLVWHPKRSQSCLFELMDNFAPFLFTFAVWAPLRWLPAALSRMPLLLLIILGRALLGSRIEVIETGMKTF